MRHLPAHSEVRQHLREGRCRTSLNCAQALTVAVVQLAIANNTFPTLAIFEGLSWAQMVAGAWRRARQILRLLPDASQRLPGWPGSPSPSPRWLHLMRRSSVIAPEWLLPHRLTCPIGASRIGKTPTARTDDFSCRQKKAWRPCKRGGGPSRMLRFLCEFPCEFCVNRTPINANSRRFDEAYASGLSLA